MTTSPRTGPPTAADVLLARAGSGDERAFGALYDHGSAAVHGLVLRAVRDPAAADEATRQVWLRVWRTAGRYTPDQGSAMAWVLSLAHRAVVDRIRSGDASSPERTGSDRRAVAPALGRAGPAPDPDAYLSLSARRRAVLLAYYDGRTTEQIGALLRVPPETVATMIHSGLEHLRAHLRASGPAVAGAPGLDTSVDADRW